MVKKHQENSRYVMPGYVFILLVSLQVLSKLSYPSDTLGWVLTAVGYAAAVGLAVGAWAWFANKYLVTP